MRFILNAKSLKLYEQYPSIILKGHCPALTLCFIYLMNAHSISDSHMFLLLNFIVCSPLCQDHHLKLLIYDSVRSALKAERFNMTI